MEKVWACNHILLSWPTDAGITVTKGYETWVLSLILTLAEGRAASAGFDGDLVICKRLFSDLISFLGEIGRSGQLDRLSREFRYRGEGGVYMIS